MRKTSTLSSVPTEAVIRTLQDEMTAPPINLHGLRTTNGIIRKISQLTSHGISSIACLLFFGLSTKEIPLWPFGLPFALAAYAVNYMQMVVVDQISISRYLHYIKNLVLAVRNGRTGIEELLGVHELENSSEKFLEGSKNIFNFLIHEIPKLIILRYVSAIPGSLARQVGWLDRENYETFLQWAIMAMLEPSVHDRIYDLRLPAFTDSGIRDEETQKLRKAVREILRQNCRDAQDHLTDSKNLVEQIQYQSEHPDLFLEALHYSNNTDSIHLLSSPRTSTIQALLAGFLALVYVLSNAGNYRATWENNADPMAQRIGSILGDAGFGTFMALRAAEALAHLLNNPRHFVTFCRQEWRKLLLFGVSIAIAAFTVGSTLSVSHEEEIPLPDLFIILGTIFDNTNFTLEILLALLTNWLFRNRESNSPQHQSAVLDRFFEELEKELNQLSDSEFLDYLSQVNTDTSCLEQYLEYFYKIFPWAENLIASQIISALKKNPHEAIETINKTGRFGKQRITLELGASALTMLVATAGFISSENTIPHILCQYLAPAVSIPIGIATTGLFGRHQHSTRRIEENSTTYAPIDESDSPEQSVCEPPHFTITAAKYIALLGLPLGVKYLGELASEWAFVNIFNLPPETAEVFGELAGTVLATVGAGLITHSMTQSMR